jgi:hypothetical protein
VKDKAIANSVAKVIGEVAKTCGVAPEDVEDMSIPTYAFA